MASGFDEEWSAVRAEATERVADGPAASGRPEAAAPVDAETVRERREAVLERLADFRSRPVLVPTDSAGGLWTADLGGVDWICAFTDEAALARFAEARGEESVEWPYRRVLGSRLLDDVVPAVGFPCGVALDAGSPGGAVFPPVKGIVPDRAAVDAGGHGDTEGHGGDRT